MKKSGRAVSVTAFASVLRSLFQRKTTPAYTSEDIRSVSVSCGHMDYSHSYSFYLRQGENGWLLDADFAIAPGHPHTEYEACSVSEADAKELLTVVKEQDVIGKLRRYKKPKIKVQVADETAYCTSVLFADGERATAAAHISDNLVTGFCRLAAKYARTAPNPSDKEESF